jgi:GTP-binding protein EngB required for normal cell division
MSYLARRPLNSTVRQVLPGNFRFRILVVGKSRSGKSSLIKTVFKVDMAAASEKADINAEFRPADNRYLIVHECSGFDSQTRDSQDSQTIRDFISRRTDASRLPPERLHAIWICVPASDAIAGRLGDGVKEILALRNVPVILVITKFDLVVAQVLLDSFSGAPQRHERARASAHTMYEESCRRIFDKEPREVPAEIVSEKAKFSDLIENLVVTTDRLITGSRGSTQAGVQAGKQRTDAVPLSWSAAVRVNHDISIQATIGVGRNRYWRSLWSSLDFADQSLKNCVNIIHHDIVEIWNLNDKTGYLFSDKFKAKMSHLVKDLAGSPNAPST